MSLGLSDDLPGPHGHSCSMLAFLNLLWKLLPSLQTQMGSRFQTGSGERGVSVVTPAFLVVWGLSALGQGSRQLG